MRSWLLLACLAGLAGAWGSPWEGSILSGPLLPTSDDQPSQDPSGADQRPENPQVIAYVTYDTATDNYRATILDSDDPEEADKLIPVDFVAKAVYRNLINETGYEPKQSTRVCEPGNKLGFYRFLFILNFVFAPDGHFWSCRRTQRWRTPFRRGPRVCWRATSPPASCTCT